MRSRVTDAFEKKGHKFVELDVRHVVDDDRVVMSTTHTAIYEPRRRDGDPPGSTKDSGNP